MKPLFQKGNYGAQILTLPLGSFALGWLLSVAGPQSLHPHAQMIKHGAERGGQQA